MFRRCMAALLALMMLAGGALAENGGLGQVADASEMTDVIDVVTPDMTPVTADALNDGEYEVAVDSSSSMFKVVGCTLTVADGAMTAKLWMKSEAYLYMYAGTAEEAAAAAEDQLAVLESADEGWFFTLPVSALDAGVTCAAFSARKQVWYPRTLLFRSDSLPAEAWRADSLTTVESLNLSDGVYTAQVALDGGRATVDSPATLTVADGACTATLVFSTKKIDYVIVDGEKFLPENTEGNAVFTVPVSAFDRKLTLIVDSTAILPATEVTYTMIFDSASLAEK